MLRDRWILVVIALSPAGALQPAQLQSALCLLGKKLTSDQLTSSNFYPFEAHEYGTFTLPVHLDDRDTQAPGFKYADWEMRGVPLRLELGPKDLEKDQCVLVRRDSREKLFTPLSGLDLRVRELLDALQVDLLARARQFVTDNTRRASTYASRTTGSLKSRLACTQHMSERGSVVCARPSACPSSCASTW